MTIAARIKVTSLMLAVFSLGIGVVLIWNSRHVEGGLEESALNSQILETTFVLRVLASEQLDHGGKRSIIQWKNRYELLGRLLDETKRGADSTRLALIEEMRQSYREIGSLFAQITAEPAASDGGTLIEREFQEAVKDLVSVHLETIVNDARQLTASGQASTLAMQKGAEKLILSAGALMLCGFLISLHLLSKAVVNPLKRLSRATDTVGNGAFSPIPGIESADEIGTLARSFNIMVDRLRRMYDSLQSEIEERQRAEQKLSKERQRLYDVLETLPVYIVLLTQDYHVRFANRFFRERFGESHGKPCFAYLFGRTEPCEVCESFTVLKTHAPHHWEWTGPDGRNYDIHDFPFTDTDGAQLIMEMGIDITERKRADEALKRTLADLTRSNADLEQFAYVASHDLQEPLRNVASCVRLLEKRYKDKLDADADKLIQYAADAAVNMKALITDLLAYSRTVTKTKPLTATDCELALDQAIANLKSAVAESGAEITRDNLPTVFADATQLVQVFQNLLSNSMKFRRQDPLRIHVSAVRDGHEWMFSVQDNGIGIESRHLDRIFLIFQRLHKKADYEGTGIGLAITKQIIERHSGRIWAESTPGVGTTFYFTMPATENRP
jgi:signal transduction histidine kinase